MLFTTSPGTWIQILGNQIRQGTNSFRQDHVMLHVTVTMQNSSKHVIFSHFANLLGNYLQCESTSKVFDGLHACICCLSSGILPTLNGATDCSILGILHMFGHVPEAQNLFQPKNLFACKWKKTYFSYSKNCLT